MPRDWLQERAAQLEASNIGLQQERAQLCSQLQQQLTVGQELAAGCRALEAGMQAAVKERDALQVPPPISL